MNKSRAQTTGQKTRKQANLLEEIEHRVLETDHSLVPPGSAISDLVQTAQGISLTLNALCDCEDEDLRGVTTFAVGASWVLRLAAKRADKEFAELHAGSFQTRARVRELYQALERAKAQRVPPGTKD
jgi:hypothetical protein